MYIAMNRFKIKNGNEKDFENLWRNRETFLDKVEGFKKFNLIIFDLKNFTKLLSELKQRQYKFKIIRHTSKKYAFFKKFFKGLKKN